MVRRVTMPAWAVPAALLVGYVLGQYLRWRAPPYDWVLAVADRALPVVFLVGGCLLFRHASRVGGQKALRSRRGVERTTAA